MSADTSPPVNSSFSVTNSKLQIAWDSTSLGEFKTCPRRYQYSIIEGWTTSSWNVDLAFGIFYHSAIEIYDRTKAAGGTHVEGVRAAVRRALTDTWNKELKRGWISGDPNKNRFTLIRTVIWYLDRFMDDPCKTVILASGKPAVELAFRINLEIPASHKEDFMLCGHLDRIAEFQGDYIILDKKTTKHALDERYFDGFTPDNQMSTYYLGGTIAYSMPVKAIMIDAAQVGATFSRFARQQIYRTPSQVEEWMKDLEIYLELAAKYAWENYWPMNDKACYWCAFRNICSQSPSVRGEWLEKDFSKRVWDPLQLRT